MTSEHVHTPRRIITDDVHCEDCGELLECVHGLSVSPVRDSRHRVVRSVEIRHSGKMPEVDWEKRNGWDGWNGAPPLLDSIRPLDGER